MQDPGVRINALRSLGTYRDSTLRAQDRLESGRSGRQRPGAGRGHAGRAGRIGRGRGAAAGHSGKGTFALRREALLGLARVDTRRVRPPRRRLADQPGTGGIGPPRPKAGRSPEPRVPRGSPPIGMVAWSPPGSRPGPAPSTGPDRRADRGRPAAAHPRRRGGPERCRRHRGAGPPIRPTWPALTAMYSSGGPRLLSRRRHLRAQGRCGHWREPDPRRRPGSIANFSARYPGRPTICSAAGRKPTGPRQPRAGVRPHPIATGRSLQDYRDLVRRFIVAPDSVARPHVFIETDQRGVLEVELFGPEAPLTVANFLRLVDRRFFDGNRWHRVVPNFVVQDGDPRGDGFGGPGGAIRDEINRMRYDIKPMLGMALSGPDTGSSQWFITLSPQPHLDGTYTVFGRAVGNVSALTRITQGDLIRTVQEMTEKAERTERTEMTEKVRPDESDQPADFGEVRATDGAVRLRPLRPLRPLRLLRPRARPVLRLWPEQDPVPQAGLEDHPGAARRSLLLSRRGGAGPAAPWPTRRRVTTPWRSSSATRSPRASR